jgi:hypothetical protein
MPLSIGHARKDENRASFIFCVIYILRHLSDHDDTHNMPHEYHEHDTDLLICPQIFQTTSDGFAPLEIKKKRKQEMNTVAHAINLLLSRATPSLQVR